MELCLLCSFPEMCEWHRLLLCPIQILVLIEKCQVDWRGRRGQFPIGGEADARFGVHVAVRDVSYNFISASLSQTDMYDRGLATQFGIFDCEESWAFLCAAEEIEVEGDCVGLVLGRESGVEVQLCHGEKSAGDIASMWN